MSACSSAVEHSAFNRLVDGSNLSRRTIYVNEKARPLRFSFFVFNRCLDD
jgi:hypothetical protein